MGLPLFFDGPGSDSYRPEKYLSSLKVLVFCLFIADIIPDL
jgi:hypothetical protein